MLRAVLITTMRDPSRPGRNLDEIPTQWSLLRLDRQDTTAAGPARQSLLLRSNQAVRRFVGAVIRDPNDADEVAQNVMVRLMNTDFTGADPARGRFRDLLRTAIRNVIRNFWSKQKRRAGSGVDVADLPAVTVAWEQWTAAWRHTVLDLAWRGLEDYQQATPGNVFLTVLKPRADHPDADSSHLADLLSAATDKEFQAENARQQPRRARVRFAELLLQEVARGLKEPTPQRVQDELLARGLSEHVRDFLPSHWRQTGLLATGEDAG